MGTYFLNKLIRARVLFEKGIPIVDIAKKLEISRETIYRWEREEWHQKTWTEYNTKYYEDLTFGKEDVKPTEKDSEFYVLSYETLHNEYKNGMKSEEEYYSALQELYKQCSEDGRKLFYKGLVIALIQEGKSATEIHDEILTRLGVQIDIGKLEELSKEYRKRRTIEQSDIQDLQVTVLEDKIRILAKAKKSPQEIQKEVKDTLGTVVGMQELEAILKRQKATDEYKIDARYNGR